MGYAALVGFISSIPVANWLIGNVGDCVPHGPCLVPVGFGLMAPSGVFAIGLAMVFRDAVHSAFGWRVAMVAILAGAALSWLIAPHLAVASAVAFLLAETADLLVYAPLRQRRLMLAVLLSGLAGAVIDSAAFLWLAFGSLDYLAGQVAGKAWASVGAGFILGYLREPLFCRIFNHRYESIDGPPEMTGWAIWYGRCIRCGHRHSERGSLR